MVQVQEAVRWCSESQVALPQLQTSRLGDFVEQGVSRMVFDVAYAALPDFQGDWQVGAWVQGFAPTTIVGRRGQDGRCRGIASVTAGQSGGQTGGGCRRFSVSPPGAVGVVRVANRFHTTDIQKVLCPSRRIL